MRRFDAIWAYDGASYQNQTQILGEGTSSFTLSAGETMYFGSSEWFSGILAFISTPAAIAPVYILEQYDGDTWKTLPLEETLTNLRTGVQLDRGSLYWGHTPFAWNRLVFISTFPETAAPLDSEARYWVRLRVTEGEVTFDRILPQMFNTYATVDEVANFIGYEFSDIAAPTRDTVRKLIRANEDWLDQFTRRSWRPRAVYNETHNFNPYGVKLRRYPPMFILSVGLWNGTEFMDMTEGRGEQYWMDQGTGFIRFTLPSFRLSMSTWLLSRYLRQPNALSVSYVAGEDFDTSRYAYDVKQIILKKVAVDLITQNDWTGMLTSGLDNVPKADKIKGWRGEAEMAANELRMPLIN